MSEDFLTIDTDQAATIEAQNSVSGNGKQVDPTLWKPSIGKNVKEYEAKIRLLPQGVNGVKNKLPASVTYQMHYLKDPKNKIYKNVPCRKTIGEDCPICEAAWAIFNKGKDTNDKVLMDLGKSRLPSTRHVINIHVREDLTKPANDGQVMKWDHTDNINKTLLEPLHDDEVKADEKQPKFKKAKEKFNPYSPRNGRDRYVIVERNPSNDMPTYENSFWDEDGLTDLAATPDAMMAILDQCHDLSAYRDVPTAEEAMNQYNEFVSLIEAKERIALTSDIQTNRTVATGNTAAPAKNVSTGNADMYFEGATSAPVAFSSPASDVGQDMFDLNSAEASLEAPAETPATETVADISDTADDDLPF